MTTPARHGPDRNETSLLAVKTYPQPDIDRCRAQIAEQIASFRSLAATATSPAAKRALDDFEPKFCNDLVVVLDALFMHRTRAIEGKDGNPANEVRMLSASIVQHDGVLVADKTIKYEPDRVTLGLAIGEPIVISLDQLERLADAYFDTIEQRFT